MNKLIKKLRMTLTVLFSSRSFSKVIIKNNNGVLKTLKDTSIIPRTNDLLYIDSNKYQVIGNVFDYDERTIYVWVCNF